MIAELVAFNAAFGVVKEFIGNGKDLSDCFGQISTTLFFVPEEPSSSSPVSFEVPPRAHIPLASHK